MTTVAVLADPPVEGVVGQELVDATPLEVGEVVSLYEAMLADVSSAVEGCNGSLLVNYRPRDHLDLDDDVSPKRLIEDIVAPAVDDPDAVRYEVQVGQSFAARAGNTVTHLLENEEEGSVHVLEPTVPLLTRQAIDSASMKLRRNPVVVAPSPGGRAGYAGFSEPIDFDGAYDSPAIESLVARADTAGLEVDFLPPVYPVDTAADLASVVSVVRARARAGRIHPTWTFEWIDRLGVRADENGQTVSLE